MRRSFSLLFAVLALGLVAGCGGSETLAKDEYGREVVRARDRVDAALEHITNSTDRTKAGLLARMKESADVIARAAGDLEAAGSAEGFDAETEQLVKAFEQLAVDLRSTAEQNEQPGFEHLLQGTQGLSFESWVEANRVLNRLRGRGVDVRPLGKH